MVYQCGASGKWSPLYLDIYARELYRKDKEFADLIDRVHAQDPRHFVALWGAGNQALTDYFHAMRGGTNTKKNFFTKRPSRLPAEFDTEDSPDPVYDPSRHRPMDFIRDLIASSLMTVPEMATILGMDADDCEMYLGNHRRQGTQIQQVTLARWLMQYSWDRRSFHREAWRAIRDMAHAATKVKTHLKRVLAEYEPAIQRRPRRRATLRYA